MRVICAGAGLADEVLPLPVAPGARPSPGRDMQIHVIEDRRRSGSGIG